MTTEQFIEKTKALIEHEGGIANVIERACMHTITHADYTLETYMKPAVNDFTLPKAVICAVLRQLAWQYEPNDKAGKRDVKRMEVHVSFQRN